MAFDLFIELIIQTLNIAIDYVKVKVKVCLLSVKVSCFFSFFFLFFLPVYILQGWPDS